MENNPQNISRTAAIIILIIIVLVIIVGGIFLIKDQNKNKNANNNYLKTYSNKEIGILFSYPSSYNSAITEEVSKEKGSQGVLAGKGIRIYFGEDIHAPSLFAASSDYEGFKEDSYQGMADIKKICSTLSLYDEERKSICLPITIGGQETIQRFFIEVDEGVVFVNRSVYLNLPSIEYPNLAIGQSYPDLADELQNIIDNQELFALKAKIIIDNLQAEKDLTATTLGQIEEFNKMLNSIKLL